MKYEAPELTALTPAISAIQSLKAQSGPDARSNDTTAAYEDWE